MQGPLVGERQSSEAIATEYANAHPIYVRKTAVSLCGLVSSRLACLPGSVVRARISWKLLGVVAWFGSLMARHRLCRRNTRTIEPFAAMAIADGEVRNMLDANSARVRC